MATVATDNDLTKNRGSGVEAALPAAGVGSDTNKSSDIPDPTSTPASLRKPPAILLGRTVNALGAVRGLARHGIRPIVITNSKHDPVLRSRYVIRGHLVHPTDDSALLRLLDSYRNERAIIIATGDAFVSFLCNNAASLQTDFHFILPAKHVIDLFIDKRVETAGMQSLGIPIPTTIGQMPSTAHQLIDYIGFPLIIKPRRDIDKSVFRVKNYIIRTPQELDGFYKTHRQHLDLVIAQELIPGDDDRLWVCNCVFGYDSQLLQTFTFNRLGTAPPHYGSTTFAISKANNEVVHYVATIGRLLGYIGPLMVEFKLDPRDQVYKYLESNPRLGLCNFFDTSCGINNVAMTYELARKGRSTQDAANKVGSGVLQEDGVVFIDLHQDLVSRVQDGESVKRIVARYLKYLRRKRVGAYWYWRDPLPALYFVARGMWRRLGGQSLAGRWQRNEQGAE
jgi:D-aspartate ligase